MENVLDGPAADIIEVDKRNLDVLEKFNSTQVQNERAKRELYDFKLKLK